jgi:hypothetical protein
MPAMSPVRPEQFGRRNRRADVKPAPKKKRIHARPPASAANTKLYLYLAGGVLFLILASFALVH